MNPLELYEKDEFDAAKLESIFFFFHFLFGFYKLRTASKSSTVDSNYTDSTIYY